MSPNNEEIQALTRPQLQKERKKAGLKATGKNKYKRLLALNNFFVETNNIHETRGGDNGGLNQRVAVVHNNDDDGGDNVGPNQGVEETNRNDDNSEENLDGVESSANGGTNQGVEETNNMDDDTETRDRNENGQEDTMGLQKKKKKSYFKQEKGQLHQMLRSYEKDFFKEHKRRVTSKADIKPVASQYRRYKEIEKAIASLPSFGDAS